MADRARSEDIWFEFGDRLLGFLRKRMSDPSEAEDLLQEVFIKVHTRMHTLEDRARLAPWLYRIARNTLIDHERKRRSLVPLDDELPALEPEPDNPRQREIASWLGSMIGGLPPGYRDAVSMYELEGVRQREIARRLGLSLSGAKSRVQRGRELLKQALLACCHFELDLRGRIMDYRGRQDCCDCCACSTDRDPARSGDPGPWSPESLRIPAECCGRPVRPG